MARKRRGRPPGEVPKTETFTTRLEPQIRRALDEAARLSGLSVSTKAGNILKAGLSKPTGKPRNYALAAAVALLAELIEGGTEQNWLADPYTATALHFAIGHLMMHFGAEVKEELADIPAAVEKLVAKMPPNFAADYRKASGFGALLAFRFIGEVEQAASSAPINEWSMPIFFSARPAQLALIGGSLKQATGHRGKK